MSPWCWAIGLSLIGAGVAIVLWVAKRKLDERSPQQPPASPVWVDEVASVPGRGGAHRADRTGER